MFVSLLLEVSNRRVKFKAVVGLPLYDLSIFLYMCTFCGKSENACFSKSLGVMSLPSWIGSPSPHLG